MSLAEYLRLPDAYTDSTIVGGSSFEVHVAHAQAAIAAGLCTVAVVTYGSTQRTVGRRAASARSKPFFSTNSPAISEARKAGFPIVRTYLDDRGWFSVFHAEAG